MLVILVLVAVFGFDTLTAGLARSYARTLSSLAWRAAGVTITRVDQSGILKMRRSLVSENSALKDEIALYEEHAALFSALQNENELLQNMVHLTEEEGNGVTARVLSSFRSSPYGTFVIAAGKNDGVTIGSSVFTPGGFLLGVVSDVDARTATVQALFAPTNTVDLIDADIAFTADGRGGGNARAEIPRDAKAAVGDVVLAQEFGRKPAGVIGSIESASSSATQKLFIRLPVNLDVLTFVYVVPHQK